MTQDGKYKIFIVDDDKFLLDMYSLKFSNEGFDVESALESRAVLEKLENEDYSPDVLLMDLVMPGMDGFELIEKIKEKKLAKKARLIILSNLGDDDEIARAKKLGVHGYIIKANTTPSEVVVKVKEIVEG